MVAFVHDEVMWAQSGTGDDFQCVHVDAWREAQAEIAKLRDIIARRLACDGSNGVWDARKNYELTEEMRAAVSPSPVTDATAIISADVVPTIDEIADGPLTGNMYRVDESKTE